MLLVYLDESYKPGRDYWLAACAIHDADVAGLCSGVRAAAAHIPPEFGLAPDVELHAHHLFHAKRAFQPLREATRVRAQTYHRCLEALSKANPGLFFIGVGWNDNLPAAMRLSSHRLAALRRLLPSIESYCARRDERCLLIADEEETTTQAVVDVVRAHQADCESRGLYSRLLDTPLFTASRHSHGVQACDLAAFLRTRKAFARSNEDPRARQIQADLWELVAPHVVEDDCHRAPSAPDILLEKLRA